MIISDYFDLNNVIEVACTRHHFEQYKIEIIDEKKYLVVKCNPTIKTIDNVGIKKLDILFDTIKLGSELTIAPISKLDFDRMCNQHDIDLILKWCYKYGAPFLETIGTVKKLDDGMIIDNRREGFRVGGFYVRIMHICDAFRYWERIYHNDHLSKEDNRFHNYDIEMARGFLQVYFTAFATVHISISFYKDTPVLKIIGQDLCDVAMIQLAVLITSPREMRIKKCEHCNDLYPAHGRSKYCKNCSRQNVYKSRRKKNPINVLYDKEYQRLYYLLNNKRIPKETYTDRQQALIAKRESLKELGDDKAISEFEKWINEQKKIDANDKTHNNK